ncbi:hypothetical protein MP478_22105 [Chryseobacterium sp. WG14]|uniref:hypothetical protein n=1 Tax=unclassified Chryseobacterium TaxID=2593645 RepID=UPI00211DED47|nr:MULTISPECIES: hypothetical protein [unclassified Chryseobacterium]MCQ9636259.1 hypothetical protein [Chryseobacterium sp. WG23]MCQ9642087.1 hypothetical protein [Chryseobacterium sp. WG14]
MKNNKLSHLSLEELQTKRKILQNITIGFGIVILIAFAILLFLSVKSKNPVLIAAGVGSLITLLPSFINLGQINNEIKSRSSK